MTRKALTTASMMCVVAISSAVVVAGAKQASDGAWTYEHYRVRDTQGAVQARFSTISMVSTTSDPIEADPSDLVVIERVLFEDHAHRRLVMRRHSGRGVDVMRWSFKFVATGELLEVEIPPGQGVGTVRLGKDVIRIENEADRERVVEVFMKKTSTKFREALEQVTVIGLRTYPGFLAQAKVLNMLFFPGISPGHEAGGASNADIVAAFRSAERTKQIKGFRPDAEPPVEFDRQFGGDYYR